MPRAKKSKTVYQRDDEMTLTDTPIVETPIIETQVSETETEVIESEKPQFDNSEEAIAKRKEKALQNYKEIRRKVAVEKWWMTEEQAQKSFHKIQ